MIINIDIYSDIHIDSWWRYYHTSPIASFFKQEDIGEMDFAIVAGDCGNGDKWRARVVDALLLKYKSVFVIKGNHCWYGERKEPQPECTIAEISGVKIVGATLWTNFRGSKKAGLFAESAIADFGHIWKMTSARMVELYSRERDLLMQNADADIVVTHFPPLIFSEHPKYAGDKCNPYFVNDDPELVRSMKPKLWVHGHTHSPFDYNFEGVRVVSNPIGYCGENSIEPVFYPKRIKWALD